MLIVKAFNHSSHSKNMFDAQGLVTVFNCDQAGDIGVLARIGSLVIAVFGKDFNALLRCFEIDRTISLRQMVVDRQRTLATGFVLDAGDDVFILVDQIDRRQMGNAGEFF